MFRTDLQLALDRDQNKSSMVSSFQIDDLMEKLKLLNFERLLLKEMKMKQIHKYYFVKSVNPGEQFYIFVSICAWLIRKTGRDFAQPQEYDDPNIVISKIIQTLREMDIPTDFPSNKLIVGAGPICIYIIDTLATQAMKISKLVLQKTHIAAEDETQLELLENDSEIVLEKVEEEQNAIQSDDDSDLEHNSLLDLKFNNTHSRKIHVNDFKVDTLTDSENWRLELERVLPNLKIVIKTDPRDWRVHLEQMKNLKNNIETATKNAENHLTKLQQDITYVMEKIDSREKHFNNDFKNLIQQYKQLSVELNQVNNKIKENELEKSEKEQELHKVTNEVENIKIQMEQRGSQMTDGSPLINIKKAIFRLKEEVAEMDVKIGVMEHSLNADLIRQRGHYTELDSFTV